MKRSSLALVFAVVFLAVSPSAWATIQQKDTVPSCLDSFNPELACFGGDVMNGTVDKSDPNYACLTDYQNCYKQCVRDQQAAHLTCDKITDPIAQANCYANADTTADACVNLCSYTTLHGCQ